MLMGRGKEGGMSLIELMVAMAVGLIVVGAVLSVYLMTLGTSSSTLQSSRLNQEVSAIMNIMVNDIRRAGYANAAAGDWGGDAALSNYEKPSLNPFNQRGSTALEVHDAADADQDSLGNGSCIVYAYDANRNGALNDNESFGFRLNADGDAIQMRERGDVTNSCTDGNWVTLNDESSVEITQLTFSLANSRCVNTLEPDNVDNDADGDIDEMQERDCYAWNPNNGAVRATYPAGDPVPVVEARNVQITLSARLISDPEVTITQRQQVSVRNNLVRLIP